MSGRMEPGDLVDVPAGAAVLLDELGALAIRTVPGRDLALVLDLGGRLNKSEEHEKHRYLLSPGQAAELVANVVIAGGRFPAFAAELEPAIKREQERLRAVDEERTP